MWKAPYLCKKKDMETFQSWILTKEQFKKDFVEGIARLLAPYVEVGEFVLSNHCPISLYNHITHVKYLDGEWVAISTNQLTDETHRWHFIDSMSTDVLADVTSAIYKTINHEKK